MKILLCPDKFKGSLTVEEVSAAMCRGIKRADAEIKVQTMPLADGGEGSLGIFAQLKDAQCIEKVVLDPLFRPVKAKFVIKGETAFIEMAQASGLLLLKSNERNPMHNSTFGTGELILEAIRCGAKHVYVMIGGSATHDGGCGMAEALGVRFFNVEEQLIKHICGNDLRYMDRIDASALSALADVRFTVLSDVKNPLYGKDGATQVYAKQKGANPCDFEPLEAGLEHLASLLNNGKEEWEGAGAAGGLGYGLMSFLGAEMKSGIQEIMKLLQFEEALKSVDFVMTGEGKLDGQTLSGKVVYGVSQLARKNNIPFGIICGTASDIPVLKTALSPKHLMVITDHAPSFQMAISHAAQFVEDLSFDMIRLSN